MIVAKCVTIRPFHNTFPTTEVKFSAAARTVSCLEGQDIEEETIMSIFFFQWTEAGQRGRRGHRVRVDAAVAARTGARSGPAPAPTRRRSTAARSATGLLCSGETAASSAMVSPIILGLVATLLPQNHSTLINDERFKRHVRPRRCPPDAASQTLIDCKSVID